MRKVHHKNLLYREDATDSSPVVFIQHAAKIQRRERWVPRKGAQGEMGRERAKKEVFSPSFFPSAPALAPRARASPFAACYMKTTGDETGAVVRALDSHQWGLGSIPGLSVICWLSLLLVLVLAPRVFLRVLRFSSLHKNQHFRKFQFHGEDTGPQLTSS